LYDQLPRFLDPQDNSKLKLRYINWTQHLFYLIIHKIMMSCMEIYMSYCSDLIYHSWIIYI